MAETWRRPSARELLIAALGTDAALLFAATLLVGFDVFLFLVAILLAASAALVHVLPHRWVVANGVFALALYAIALARLRLDGSGLIESERLVDALVGPFGLVSVIVASIGALTGPFAAQHARAGAVLEPETRPRARSAGHGKTSR